MKSVPYCRLIDRERRSEPVQTPIGLLILSASGKRMTARMHLVKDLLPDLGSEKEVRREKAGALLDASPDIADHVRVMLTDQQLMGAKLALAAERFAHLSRETARIYKQEGSSERFKEIANIRSMLLTSLLSNILISDADPLASAFLEMFILWAFRSDEKMRAITT
ncbi:hypothetical protein HYW94_02475 [Candidatus Uhrbacteria bacterium]|nr:hypothetical protein [Candidatus Uhrbacteria bacterium]